MLFILNTEFSLKSFKGKICFKVSSSSEVFSVVAEKVMLDKNPLPTEGKELILVLYWWTYSLLNVDFNSRIFGLIFACIWSHSCLERK